jgi:hypothetical protein
MDTVGYIAVVLAAILVVGLLILGVVSLSDIRRYLRIRNM